MNIDELSLWGLDKAFYEIVENGFVYDEETGEVYFTSDDLDKIQMGIDEQLNKLCGFVKFYESKQETYDKRCKEIKKEADFFGKKAQHISNFIKKYMEERNIDKKILENYRLSTRKSTSVKISDENKVYEFLVSNPKYKDECMTQETVTKLSKTGLKNALSEVDIPGVEIVENKNIVIK